eukprot:2822055-Rhodomonas_salina.1
MQEEVPAQGVDPLQTCRLSFSNRLPPPQKSTSDFTRAMARERAPDRTADAETQLDSTSDTADAQPNWKALTGEIHKLVKSLAQRRMNELELARDTQFTCFVRLGESVAHALGAASQLTGQQCRVWYQAVAGLYPTQAYLARIGAEPSDICPFCSEERETM